MNDGTRAAILAVLSRARRRLLSRAIYRAAWDRSALGAREEVLGKLRLWAAHGRVTDDIALRLIRSYFASPPTMMPTSWRGA